MTSEASQPGAMSAADLYRAHAEFVARYVYRLGVSAAQVDDVVQEVFLVVHKRGGYVPGPAKPTSYLAAIATHAAAHARRSARRRDARHADAPIDEQCAADAPPDRELFLRDEVELVRAALGRLDPALAATLLLADGEDEPCPSIAAAMGVPLGTVYFRLHSARRKFGAAVHKLEAQRGHEERSARTAPPPLTGALARRGIMIGLFETSRRKFEGTRAFTLLRATRYADGGRFEAAAGLARHLEEVARAGAGAGAAAGGGAAGAFAGSAPALGKWAGALLAGGALAGLVALRSGAQREPVAVAEPAPVSTLAAPPEPEAAPPEIEADVTDALEAVEPTEPERVRYVRARRAERSRALPRELQQRTVSVAQPTHGTPAAEPVAASSEPAPTPEPTPTPKASTPTPRPPALNPLAALAQAERLARTRPDEALALLARLDESAAARYLAEELAFVRLSAHYHAGHAAQVRTDGPAFLAAHPTSAFASRVRAMLDALER